MDDVMAIKIKTLPVALGRKSPARAATSAVMFFPFWHLFFIDMVGSEAQYHSTPSVRQTKNVRPDLDLQTIPEFRSSPKACATIGPSDERLRTVIVVFLGMMLVQSFVTGYTSYHGTAQAQLFRDALYTRCRELRVTAMGQRRRQMAHMPEHSRFSGAFSRHADETHFGRPGSCANAETPTRELKHFFCGARILWADHVCRALQVVSYVSTACIAD